MLFAPGLRLPQPRLVVLAKAALSALGKALAEEFGGRRLRGDQRGRTCGRPPAGPAIGVRASRGRTSPVGSPGVLGLSIGRFTDPREVAALVVFLACGRVPDMSGSDLVIDGGV